MCQGEGEREGEEVGKREKVWIGGVEDRGRRGRGEAKGRRGRGGRKQRGVALKVGAYRLRCPIP